ncbi:MAG: hypothetical protein H0Z29_02940 [Candidatus Marinimicrobia bacterium]|nr:hypothetical protein [Candidatus Neomarinimicrobiota bacterium]
MKENLFIISFLLFIITSCSKTELDKNSGNINYMKMINYGCQSENLSNYLALYNPKPQLDTIMVNDDSLFICIRFITNCGAKFIDSVLTYNNTIEITLDDTGPPADCICLFKNDFVFDNFYPGSFHLLVNLLWLGAEQDLDTTIIIPN